MENNEIVPAPVTTIGDLLGKIDMIHAAAIQWNEGDNRNDDDLVQALRVRIRELMNDIIAVGVTAEQWDIIAAKFNTISDLFRDKLITTLDSAYDQS